MLAVRYHTEEERSRSSWLVRQVSGHIEVLGRMLAAAVAAVQALRRLAQQSHMQAQRK